MSPSKYSPQIVFPPIRSAPVDVVIEPDAATELTSAPLMYRRSVVAS